MRTHTLGQLLCAAALCAVMNPTHSVVAGELDPVVAPAPPAPHPPAASGARAPAAASRSDAIGQAPPASPKRAADRAEFAFKPIRAIQINADPAGTTRPPDVAVDFFARTGRSADAAPRDWMLREYTWIAPEMCHRPLYFEEINLERHGLSFGIAQPAVSSAQFFGRTLALPYLIAAQPPRECVYTLGHDRPGTCVPYTLYIPPWDWKAVTTESAVVAGAILLFP